MYAKDDLNHLMMAAAILHVQNMEREHWPFTRSIRNIWNVLSPGKEFELNIEEFVCYFRMKDQLGPCYHRVPDPQVLIFFPCNTLMIT